MRRPLRTGLLMTALLAVAAANAQQGDGTNYVELKRIAEAAQKRAFADKMKAEAMALRLNMPIRTVDAKTGRVVEIMGIGPEGVPIYFETRNRDAAITTRASRVFPGGGAGLSLTGTGVVMGVWDGGTVFSTHNELTGRVTVLDATGHDGHATHVAGTMIASGAGLFSGQALAKGMSYQGTVRSYDWTDDVPEAAAEAGSGTPLYLSNHSYGPGSGWTDIDPTAGEDWYWYGTTAHSQLEDSKFGMYLQACADFDAVAFNAPNYLSVWSAGNDRNEGPSSQPVTHHIWTGTWTTSNTVRNLDGNGTGYDSISGVGVAKNTLCVGAVDDVPNYTGPGSVAMSDFSCWGPTDDGRIKPDVVGNGVELLSSWNTGVNQYAYSWGTSMSAPNVTGSLGLLVQHYRATHGGANMRSATVRGLVIHTADECGPNTGPDYMNGWGLMDTEAAAQVITDDQTNPNVIREDALPNGGTDKWYVTSDGVTPLRFTLCWTDPAAAALQTSVNNRSPRLVHDLDMTVKIGNTTYSPYMLSYLNPSAAATTGDNNIDNVEVIDVPAPAAGVYEITIDHDGTLTSTQNYSLIVTGPRVSPIMSNFTVNGTWITGGNSTNGTVTIPTPAPAGGVKFYPRTSPAGIFNVNTPVIIAEGQTSKSFPIVGTGNVNTNTAYSIWMHSGYNHVGVAGTMVPLRINALTVTPNPASSGSSVNVFIGLNGPAPAGGLTIAIDRAPTFWIQAPTSTVIAQGQFNKTLVVPITAGLVNPISNARITITQQIQPSGSVSLSKLFTINP